MNTQNRRGYASPAKKTRVYSRRSTMRPSTRRIFGIGLSVTALLVVLSPLLLLVTLTIASDGPAFYRVPRLGINGKLFKWPQFRRIFLFSTKRAFDIFISVIALFVLAPLFILIGLAIKVTSNGPVFYRASRVGKDGKLFKMFKFCTMVPNADKVGPGITLNNDNRITPVGRVLRKSKLDELPQLINVLRGEMSIVGPRPEDPRYVALYTPLQRTVLSVRPGITSQASVHFRDESAQISGTDWENHYVQVIMPAKLQLDIAYAQQPNLKQDLALIAKTVVAVFAN